MAFKRFVLGYCVLSLACQCIFAQQSGPDTLLKMPDMAVPDIPAFKALGIDNSKMLTPSTARAFAMDLSPFYSNGSVSFPQNFAVEFAPARFMNKLNTLRNYDQNSGKRLLLNSSLSIATNRDSTKKTYLSIGYRGTVIHKSHDIFRALFAKSQAFDSITQVVQFEINIVRVITNNLRNEVFVRKLDANGRDVQAVDSGKLAYYFTHYDSLAKANPSVFKQVLDDSYTPLKSILAAFKINITKITQSQISSRFDDDLRAVAKRIINTFQDAYWNATRFDWALAWTAQSKDSAAKGSEFYAFDLWATLSVKVHSWGQWLLGINARAPRSDSGVSYYNFNAMTRLYAGINKIKGFGEVQWQYSKTNMGSSGFVFSTGAEVRISTSFWAVATAGYATKVSGSFLSQLVSGLNLKYGFN